MLSHNQHIYDKYTAQFSEKDCLKKKFERLARQHYKRTPSSTSDLVVLGPIDEPPADNIMTIQVELTKQEQALLSLGTNFTLCPQVDDRFINEINTEVAACTYRLRWSHYICETHSCPSLFQYFQRQGAPIQLHKPFANPLPTKNIDNEIQSSS